PPLRIGPVAQYSLPASARFGMLTSFSLVVAPAGAPQGSAPWTPRRIGPVAQFSLPASAGRWGAHEFFFGSRACGCSPGLRALDPASYRARSTVLSARLRWAVGCSRVFLWQSHLRVLPRAPRPGP